MKILLKIRYNGAGYCGFQTQPNGITVQAVLTEAFSRLFGFPCHVTGCSRTDSGVHALGFCATVTPADASVSDTDWCRVPVGKIHRAINVLLPDDIAVIAAAHVADDFHPRYNVVSKTYEYRIHNAPYRDPFLQHRAHHEPRRIDESALERMNAIAQLFVGTHDFSGFMAAGSSVEDTTRTVYAAHVRRDGEQILYRVEANGFLYNMVRIMAGSLIDAAYDRKSAEDIRTALMGCSRSCAGFTAPPDGLYLYDVKYDREIRWICL